MAQCTLEAYLGSTPNTKNIEKKSLIHGDLASSHFLEAKQGTPLHHHLSISIQKIDSVL